MKAVYKLTINENNTIDVLHRYSNRNNEWETSTIEEMGAKRILGFINSRNRGHLDIEANDSIVTMEQFDDDVFITLKGSRDSLAQSHTAGINSVLCNLLSNGHAELVEYRTTMPALSTVDVWDINDRYIANKVRNINVSPSMYINIVKLRAQYENAILKYAERVYNSGGYGTAEYGHLMRVGKDLSLAANPDRWRFATHSELSGIELIKHTGSINDIGRSPLNMSLTEATILVESNKDRFHNKTISDI